MKKVLVTGSKGMLGQDLTSLLEKEGLEVIKTDIDNLDITNFEQVESVFQETMPDFVVHCAAYTNVDKSEEEPEIAFKINEIGTRNLAKTCSKMDIPILCISTDYVFSGEANKPYLPTDKREPLGVYGKSKAAGEVAIEENCKKYYIVRTSWLYGHKGKNFVDTIIGLAEKMPEIKVVNDQFGCPTWTVDLAGFILKLVKGEREYGIYHFCGSGEISWYDFACEIVKSVGLSTKVNPCTTEEFPRPAKRPKYSVMDNGGECRDWKEALKKYIELRG